MANQVLSAIAKIDIVLRQRGFQRDWSRMETPTYFGELDPHGLNIPVSIFITDLNFVTPPPIKISSKFALKQKMLPHIMMSDRSICYFASGSVVLDRYNPGGAVLCCIEQAERVVKDAINGRSNGDFANEFEVYWGSHFVSIDLPDNYLGLAKIHFFDSTTSKGAKTVLTTDDSWLISYNKKFGGTKPVVRDCLVLATERSLTIDPDSTWPPRTLFDLNRWFRFAAPEIEGKLEHFFVKTTETEAAVALCAANGIYIYRAKLPSKLQTPEFMKSRRKKLPAIIKRYLQEVEIDLINGMRADAKYIFSRNMDSIATLAGKRILLIGCGTIGGYVAHQLSQSGAGAEGGVLSLADPDNLSTANIGRHLLGINHLFKNKAEQCKEFILNALPMLRVEAYGHTALPLLANHSRYDLVIDATGEEGLSLAINDLAVRSRPIFPTVIFGYLIGNGSATQALLVDDPQYACFKCLKPDLAGPPRYKGLKPGVIVNEVSNLSCGDPFYIPFPVTRSVSAASQIVEMALDWANDNVKQRFRSITLDAEKAFINKNGNPVTSKMCPACQAT